MASASPQIHFRDMGKGPYKRRLAKPSRKSRNFIREWREHRGMTQERLAELARLSVPTISNIESGAHGYSQRSLEAIAEALDAATGDLLSRRPGVVELADELAALEPNTLKQALQIIRVMAAGRRQH